MPVFTEQTLIDKGWSGDKKYRAVLPDGRVVLYRLSDPASYERKAKEFAYLQSAATLGIPMCMPLEFGQNGEGVYSLTTFIDGEDMESAIGSLSEAEQYHLGEDAGRALAKLHTLPEPSDAEDWEIRFNRKIDRKIRGYTECPLRFEGDRHMLRYIRENRHLLAGRPQCMQHGDYHIGNLMLRDGQAVVIDFNRFDWGDPWEEFNRIVWCAQSSPAFASGRVRGYFYGEPPMEFWRLLALYISSNTLSSMYWAIPFGQKEIDTMMCQAAEVLEWYDNMKNPVPTWYR